MTRMITIFHVYLAIALILFPVSLWSQEMNKFDVIGSPNRVRIIDRLSTSSRHAVLIEIRKQFLETGDIQLIKTLCQIEPWSLGGRSEDIAFQNEILQSLDFSVKPWSDHFELSDCAAANRLGSYFSVIPTQLREMRSAFESGSGQEWVANAADAALDSVKKVDAPLLQGTKGKRLRSFFPLLNVQHASEVLAARAVANAADNPKESISILEQAAELFQAWERGSPKRFEVSRNGFRYRNDLAYYKNFYRALAGDEEALVRLSELVDWPTLVTDEAASAIVPPNVSAVLVGDQSDYVDPIYFGRLLPGAAKSVRDEMDRWWNTNYPTRDIAKISFDCLSANKELSLHKKISAVDECIAKYDPADWRVELASFRGSPAEEQRAKDELARLLGNIYSIQESTALEPYRNEFDIYFENRRWFIRTEQKFSRKEVRVFKEVLDLVKGNPQFVFFRQRVF